jgi:sarcosine oxidase subunit beta
VGLSADVVIIGGGVIGTSTAFHLAKAGVKHVTLLERSFIGAGATGKSGALVRQHYTNPYDGELAAKSIPYFLHWEDLVGVGDPRYVKSGMLRLADLREIDRLEANVEMLQGVGVNTWVIGPHDVKEIDDRITVEDIPAAAWEPDSGYAEPSATAFGFADAAASLGVSVRTGVEATGIVVAGGKVTGVETPEGTIATEKVLLAGGAWSPRLLAPLGLDYGLKPTRVQVCVFRRPETTARRHPVIIDGVNIMWMRAEGEFGSLVGIEIEHSQVDPDHFDEGLSETYIAATHKVLKQRMPIMQDAPLRGGWTGVVTLSPDAHIILGDEPSVPGLTLAVGDSGTNFKTGPAIGKCLTEVITTGKATTVDLTAFRPTRFAEGKPLIGAHEYGDEGVTDVWR